MSTRKRLIADLLFGCQLIMGVFFVGSRIIRMSQTLQGVLLSEFILIGTFSLMNLSLAITANRVKTTRVAKQTVFVYSFWAIALIGCGLSVLLQGTYVWSITDTVTLVVALLAGAVTVAFGKVRHQLTIRDPIVRGCVAMVFKGWPQLALAYNIVRNGGAGIPLLAIILGHVMIFIRIGQLVFALREAGWDRNRRGSMISEVGNELTWVVTTIAWIVT